VHSSEAGGTFLLTLLAEMENMLMVPPTIKKFFSPRRMAAAAASSGVRDSQRSQSTRSGAEVRESLNPENG